jgi:hypothetical protein
MGKTIKHGYGSLSHSFNSHHSHVCRKRINRRRKKMQYKNDFNYTLQLFDISENFNSSLSVVGNNYEFLRRPEKMGYCPNSSTKLKDIIDDIYGKQCQTNLKFMSENEKIAMLMTSTNEHKKLKMLKDMQKQIKRRCKIGYFKGH